jgi:hypothetical protein
MMDKQNTPSKAEEAGFRVPNSIDHFVPSYADHIADDLYTEGIPNYGTGLPSLLDPEDEAPENLDPYDELLRGPAPQQEETIPPPFPSATSSGPLSLTLDKALVFPNTVPATALYSLNYTLNTMGNSVTLSRSVPGVIRMDGTSGKIMDKDLYDIARPPLSLLEFHIKGKRKSTYPGTGNLQLKTGLTGKYWECKFKEKVVLKGKNGTWSDGQGRLVAKEMHEVVAKHVSKKGKEIDSGVRENPGLAFEGREGEVVDALLVDLMVAVWCAKTWYAETFEARMGKPAVTESEFTRIANEKRLITNTFWVASHRITLSRQ